MESRELHLPDTEWTVTKPFWDACRLHELRLPRCECGTWVWYPQPRCPACRGAAIGWERVSGDAHLFTWTTVYRSFIPAHANRVPYVTGIVELVEHPALRLTSFVVDAAAASLAVGLPLRVRFERIERDIVLPVFAPANG
jgi:uncharacterized OB-fold protein